ncbi:hypothetical protein GIB67_038440 [Kingdonia uniflora]|uniref:Uncharacterized protein n=1 Tax=Kingdonia uniflora TaxID=39325 RepID=A0A7J7NP99_9MAGN|nr:hypothetical protein GIB67_038440 [Kingdonia uniflora]
MMLHHTPEEVNPNSYNTFESSSVTSSSNNSKTTAVIKCFIVDSWQVEVALPGTEVKEEDIKPDAGTMKVLPPWMIKQGMQLTNEQRGGVRQELNMGNGSGSADLSDDKKSDEYVKAYYAALLQRQQEQDAKAKQQESAMADTISDYRHVGMKSKREEDEGDDDVEWEEEAPNTGNTSEHHKVHDLNLEADAIEDGEDDIDWEEG